MSKKLEQAKNDIILNSVYYPYWMLKIEFIPDYSCWYMKTNGRAIYYNPDTVEIHSIAETKGVIIHEIDHIIHKHHIRRGDRDKQKYNEAADYAINPSILDSGYILPDNVLVNSVYNGMDAEQIYGLMPDPPEGNDNNDDQQQQDGDSDQNQQDQQQDKPNNGESFGEVCDAEGTDEELKELEQEIEQQVLESAMLAEKHGSIPGHIARLVEKITKPEVDWRALFHSFLNDYLKSDYTWTRPNPRYISSGIYLPSLKNLDNLSEMCFIHDTSISRGQKEMDKVYTECMSALQTFHVDQLRMLYVDCELQGEQIFTSYEPLDFKPIGGGGTSFVPGFKHLVDNGITPNVVVYFTDGECDEFPDEEYFPTIWVIHGGVKEFNPPFGEVIIL